MKIKAWAAREANGLLTPFSYEKEVGAHDVLIKIEYCSLIKADVFFIDNFWEDTKYPFVPSTEMFGTVTQTGADVKNLAVGDYVGVGYQVYSCMTCAYCKQGNEQFCKEQRVIGIHEYGGLAEHIIVDSHFAQVIPPALQKAEYVYLTGYGLTAYSAIKHSKLKKGMKIGVVGVGNLGHIAGRMLAAMGHTVTAFTHTPRKIPELKKIGIQAFIEPLDAKEMESHEGSFDHIFVTTYHDYDWSAFISLLKPEGNICFIGLPQKNISFPAVLLGDYARRTVSGSYTGSREEMGEVLAFAEKHELAALNTVYPIGEANTLITALRENKIDFNTVVKME